VQAILTLDTTALLFALVNAVQELRAEVAALGAPSEAAGAR
jgi:hypothetical protein